MFQDQQEQLVFQVPPEPREQPVLQGLKELSGRPARWGRLGQPDHRDLLDQQDP